MALDKYLADNGYTKLKALVAFSGEVNDPESFPSRLRDERDPTRLHGRDILTFDDERAPAVGCEQLQTGFDEPKLCGMCRP